MADPGRDTKVETEDETLELLRAKLARQQVVIAECEAVLKDVIFAKPTQRFGLVPLWRVRAALAAA